MMKKMSTALLTTALVAPLFLGATSVNAAEVAKDDSEAHVTMVKRPVTPPEGNDGPLRLESISTINFGTQYISGSTATYNARYVAADEVAADKEHAGKFSPTMIVVNDDRGTNQGWSLQATATDFSTDKAGIDPEAQTLAGAYITLRDGKGNEAGTQDSEFENPGAVPASNAIVLKGADVPIASAAKNDANATGVGRTNISFGEYADNESSDEPTSTDGNEKVMLTIPGKAKKAENATYTATITWKLLDEPSTN